MGSPKATQDNIAFVITIAGGFVLGRAVARLAMQAIGARQGNRIGSPN